MEYSLESHIKTLLTCIGTGQELTTVCKHFQSTLIRFCFITTLTDTDKGFSTEAQHLRTEKTLTDSYMIYVLSPKSVYNHKCYEFLPAI